MNNNACLGVDTSNYTTSVAIYSGKDDILKEVRKPLTVKSGSRGLRQSEALFQHLKSLPDVLSNLFSNEQKNFRLSCVGVSTAPRDDPNSYMPCFLAGESVGNAIALSHDIPMYKFSHQSGHIAAAIYGSGKHELLEKEFFAWHLSGGTSELVLVKPSADKIICQKRIGGSLDISAGQIIDRIGVKLGIHFPCGAELDKLSKSYYKNIIPARLWSDGTEISFSGLENKAMELIKNNANHNYIAKYLFTSIADLIIKSTVAVTKLYRPMPVLCCGGVMSNSLIRTVLSDAFEAVFAPNNYSIDNAMGIAYLAYLKDNAKYS